MYVSKFGCIVRPVVRPAERQPIGRSQKIQAQFSQPRTCLLVKLCIFNHPRSALMWNVQTLDISLTHCAVTSGQPVSMPAIPILEISKWSKSVKYIFPTLIYGQFLAASAFHSGGVIGGWGNPNEAIGAGERAKQFLVLLSLRSCYTPTRPTSRITRTGVPFDYPALFNSHMLLRPSVWLPNIATLHWAWIWRLKVVSQPMAWGFQRDKRERDMGQNGKRKRNWRAWTERI